MGLDRRVAADRVSFPGPLRAAALAFAQAQSQAALRGRRLTDSDAVCGFVLDRAAASLHARFTAALVEFHGAAGIGRLVDRRVPLAVDQAPATAFGRSEFAEGF